MGTAVFVDWENLVKTAIDDGHAPAPGDLIRAVEEAITRHLVRNGQSLGNLAIVAPDYIVKGAERQELRNASSLVSIVDVPAGNKNMADMVIAVNALDWWHVPGLVDGVAILSDDDDLKYLSKELDRRGRSVQRPVVHYCYRDQPGNLLKGTRNLCLSIGMAVTSHLSPAFGPKIEVAPVWLDAALYVRTVGVPAMSRGRFPFGPWHVAPASNTARGAALWGLPAWRALSLDQRAQVQVIDDLLRTIGGSKDAGVAVTEVVAAGADALAASGIGGEPLDVVRAMAASGLLHLKGERLVTPAQWREGLLHLLEEAVLRVHVEGEVDQRKLREKMQKRHHRDAWEYVVTALVFGDRIGGLLVRRPGKDRFLSIDPNSAYAAETIDRAERVLRHLPRVGPGNAGAFGIDRARQLLDGVVPDPRRWLDTLTRAGLLMYEPGKGNWHRTTAGQGWP